MIGNCPSLSSHFWISVAAGGLGWKMSFQIWNRFRQQSVLIVARFSIHILRLLGIVAIARQGLKGSKGGVGDG